MNSPLEMTFWLRLLGALFLESSLIVGLAFGLQCLTQSTFWRRAIWQICLLCLSLLVVFELTGLGKGVALWATSKPAPERKFSARIVPLAEQFEPVQEMEMLEAPAIAENVDVPPDTTLVWPGALWLIGSGVVLTRIFFARILFLSFRWRTGKIINASLLNRVNDLAQRLGIARKIDLFASPSLSSPIAFGIVQPSIGLPPGFGENYNPAQQEVMLTHELAHLSARDPLWYLLTDLTAAVLWWQPAVWLARRRLQAVSELAADEASAILENGPNVLAECLVKLGQQLAQARSFGGMGVEGNGFRSHLGQRVERLLKLDKQTRRPVSRWHARLVKISMPVVLVALIAFTSGWMENKDVRHETSLKTALQRSWSDSLASTVLVAALANNSPEESNSPSETALPTLEKQLAELDAKVARTQFKLDALRRSNDIVELGDTNVFSGAKPVLHADQRKQAEEDQLRAKYESYFKAKRDLEGQLQARQMLKLQIEQLKTGDSSTKPVVRITPPTSVTNTVAVPEKQILITGKFYQLPPGVSETDIIKKFLLGEPRVLPDAPARLLENALAQNGAKLLGMPRVVTLEGRQAEVSALAQKTNAAGIVFFEGVMMKVLAKNEDRSILLELNLSAGAMTEQGKPLEDQGVSRKVKMLLEPSQHLILQLSSATNYLAIITPSLFTPGSITSQELGKEALTRKVQQVGLVQDGKLLFEMGKLDDAEAKLKQALKTNPENKAAIYYLGLIKEERYAHESGKRSFSGNTGRLLLTNPPKEVGSSAFDETLAPAPLLQPTMPVKEVKPLAVVSTSPPKQKILDKLNSIRLSQTGYDGLPLGEVLKGLTDEVAKLDPDKVGVNFMIDSHFSGSASAPTNDISQITVKITPPLRNLRLSDALDAIVSAADQPIRYEVRDYAIVFFPKEQEAEPLYFRTYKVDSSAFAKALKIDPTKQSQNTVGFNPRRVIGDFDVVRPPGNETQFEKEFPFLKGKDQLQGPSMRSGLNFVSKTNYTATINDRARTFFWNAGVNLNPPKSIFFNDRTGVLAVRATLKDLEIVGQAIQAFAPPQVVIEVKFVEIDEASSKALGFDWFLAGTDAKLSSNAYFPTLITNTTVSRVAKNMNVSLTNSATFMVRGILTEPQYRTVLQTLENKGGDILAAPRVTTLSGRQAQISILDVQTVVTGINNGATNGTSTNNIQTEQLYTGPVLDVIPFVSEDGYSIQTTLIATLTQFLGYDENSSLSGLSDQLPLPRIRMRQITTSAIVYDGQTVVLGGLISEAPKETKNKTGRVESHAIQKRNLIVLVTPTIVDPAGNRVHSDEDIAPLQNSIPKQPAPQPFEK